MILQPPCTGWPTGLELLRDEPLTGAPHDDPEVLDEGEPHRRSRRQMRCRACDAPVADEADVFALAGHGPVQVHANPAGLIFDILTVRQARLVGVGAPSMQFTWFAGYAWTIVVCGQCARHLGWRFEGAGQPPRFYGLLLDRITRP